VQGELTSDKFNFYFEIIIVIYEIWAVKKILPFKILNTHISNPEPGPWLSCVGFESAPTDPLDA